MSLINWFTRSLRRYSPFLALGPRSPASNGCDCADSVPLWAARVNKFWIVGAFSLVVVMVRRFYIKVA